jgi:hypothetical protein
MVFMAKHSGYREYQKENSTFLYTPFLEKAKYFLRMAPYSIKKEETSSFPGPGDKDTTNEQ